MKRRLLCKARDCRLATRSGRDLRYRRRLPAANDRLLEVAHRVTGRQRARVILPNLEANIVEFDGLGWCCLGSRLGEVFCATANHDGQYTWIA